MRQIQVFLNNANGEELLRTVSRDVVPKDEAVVAALVVEGRQGGLCKAGWPSGQEQRRRSRR